MGLAITKLYIVSPGTPSDPARHIFGTIQEAIDVAEIGSTIVLGAGEYTGYNHLPIQIKSYLLFVGLQDAKIISPIVGKTLGVTFQNVIFSNNDNKSIEFKDSKGLLFRNCEFQIKNDGSQNIKDSDRSREASYKRHHHKDYGIQILNGSATFDNSFFYPNIENIKSFALIAGNSNTTYIRLSSPVIRVQYKNVCKIETFVFHGIKNSSIIPYFEAFSSSIHYSTNSIHNKVYDGHCCLKGKKKHSCKKNHCSKKHKSDKCKHSHHCCDKKCNHNKIEHTTIKLYRNCDCVNSSINNTKIFFSGGKGQFDIAAGDSLIYINGLTASASVGDDWEIGDFHNILLKGFMSNLKCACDIKECQCIDECPKDESSDDNDDDHHINNYSHPPFGILTPPRNIYQSESMIPQVITPEAMLSNQNQYGSMFNQMNQQHLSSLMNNRDCLNCHQHNCNCGHQHRRNKSDGSSF